ncbi:MAG TPA: LamG-like jellyroll fold domain-containing protein [Planctomycetota bacterium]
MNGPGGMGQEIVYCFKCLTRLIGGDFEKGKAFRYGPRVSCKACLPHLLQELSPAEQEEFVRASKPADSPSSTRIPLTPRPSTTRRRGEGDVPKGKGMALGIGLGAGAALVLVVGLILLRTPPPPPPPPDPPKIADPAPSTEGEALRTARRAVEKARDPSVTDPAVRLALWSEAARLARGTPLYEEALDGERELIERRAAAREKELAELDEVARPLATAGEPAKAAAVYEAARGRHADAEWAAALSEKTAALRRDAAETGRRLTADAVEAARKGDAAGARAAEEAVARLGYPEPLAEFRAALAAVKPAEKPPAPRPATAEEKAYREAWIKLAPRTAARDFEGAEAELTKIAAELKEELPKLDAKRDLEDLVRLRELYAELGRAAERLPAGKDLSLEVFNDNGARVKISGKVAKAWPGRVELAGEPTTFVELEDLCAGAVADVLALTRKLAWTDSRALALLCAAEGDGTRALRLATTLPERVRSLVKDGAARVPKRTEKEREARKAFYEAERAYRDGSSRAEAVALYRKLAAEFADAAIVKGDADLVRRRAEEGREAFLGPGALKAGGTFKPAKDEKLGSVWTSSDDSDPAKAVANFLEFEFLAVADSAYKAWVYAGGCCGEVFGFSLQATDLAGPKAASAAPGGEAWVPVRHGVSSVKPKHEDHMGPKSPKKWAWVPLPLPKFAAGGLKRVRVLTNQKGFSVGCAFVSSQKATPPGEADLRERLGRGKDADPSLVAWWRMDEPGVESSGQGPMLLMKGAVEWLKDGKLGGAVKVGAAGQLEAPHRPALNGFPLTVSAWARTTAVGDKGGVVCKYLAGSNNGWNLHLLKGEIKAWYFRSATNKVMESPDGVGGGPINDGAWHHVVFVVDADGGRLFVDGVRKGAAPWLGPPGPATTTQPLSIGVFPVSTGSRMFEGSVDDVRIYARGLSDAEVMALYTASGGTPEESRPWTAMFDGKPGFLSNDSEKTWKIEDGALVRASDSMDAGQSRLDIGDGEFRMRVEAAGLSRIAVSVRQGVDGRYTAEIKGPISDGPHEIVFTCAGDDVKATVDGKAATVEPIGRPRRGRIQIAFNGKSLRILSVEQRPLP